MSLMVSRVAASLFSVPMIAVSPASTFSRVMRPLIGATIVVFVRLERALRSAAAATSTWCVDDSYSAVFTSAAVRNCSSCSSEMSVAFAFLMSAERRRFAFACSRLAFDCADCARADASDASARWTSPSYCDGSICSRNCPRETICPSFTARRTMRPVMSELRSTLVRGRTWPLAVTEAIRSRRCTDSIRTSVALLPFFIAPSTDTAAAAIRSPTPRTTSHACSWPFPVV